MKPRGSDIADEVLAELARARDAHPRGFNSAHEGFAVLLEEVDELRAEVWCRVKRPDAIRIEAIQVAAMAIRFVQDVCDGGAAADRRCDAAALRGIAGSDCDPISDTLRAIANRIEPT